jgi:hypothetical protein
VKGRSIKRVDSLRRGVCHVEYVIVALTPKINKY